MLPLGQAFIEEDNCCINHCNDIAIDKTKLFNVNYKSEYSQIFLNNFSDYINLNANVNIGDDIEIFMPPDFVATINPLYTPPRTQFYFQTENKLYYYFIANTGLAPFEILYNTEDIIIFRVRYSANANTMRNRLADAFNNFVPSQPIENGVTIELGLVANNTGTSVIIQGITKKIVFGALSATTNVLPNPAPQHFGFFWYWSATENIIKGFNFNKYIYNIGSNGWDFQGAFYQNLINLQDQELKMCRVTLTITNDNPFDLTYTYLIKNSGFIISPTFTIDIPANTIGDYSVEFQLPNMVLGTNNGQLETLFLIPTNITDTLTLNDEFFKIDNIKFETKDVLLYATITDNNSSTYIPLSMPTVEPIFDLNAFTCTVSILLTDTSREYQSILYKLLQDNICQLHKQLKWSNDCDGVEHELYLLTSLEKSSIDTIEQVAFINNQGQKRSIYNHTIAKYEYRIHPYTESVIENIEVALKSDNITIANKEYYNGGDNLKSDNLDYCTYTARIDLYKKGTEHIKTNCCC